MGRAASERGVEGEDENELKQFALPLYLSALHHNSLIFFFPFSVFASTEMERKVGKGCPPPPPSSTSTPSGSGGSDFRGEMKGSSSSSSSGLFNSVFPRPLSTERNVYSHSDIFGPPTKQGCADQAWINARVANEGNTSKGNKERTTAYQGERSDPCFLSDSLLYGGQDICAGPKNSKSSGTSYNYTKDGQDDSDNDSDFACRGNWWQGSLYY